MQHLAMSRVKLGLVLLSDKSETGQIYEAKGFSRYWRTKNARV